MAIVEFYRENTLNLPGDSGCFWYIEALKVVIAVRLSVENLCGINNLMAVAGVFQDFPDLGGGKVTLDWQA